MVAQDRPKSLNMSTYDTLRESRLGLGVKGSQVQILSARQTVVLAPRGPRIRGASQGLTNTRG